MQTESITSFLTSLGLFFSLTTPPHCCISWLVYRSYMLVLMGLIAEFPGRRADDNIVHAGWSPWPPDNQVATSSRNVIADVHCLTLQQLFQCSSP